MIIHSNFGDYCKRQHDFVCNQMYNKTLPYSFHLEAVVAQGKKFFVENEHYNLKELTYACYGHDLIEDARVTYNDVVERLTATSKYDKDYDIFKIANAIYGCTESTGKNRTERHDAAYLARLLSSPLSISTKLADITANITFGLLTNSGMLNAYKKEFPVLKTHFNEQQVADNLKIIKHIEYLLAS